MQSHSKIFKYFIPHSNEAWKIVQKKTHFVKKEKLFTMKAKKKNTFVFMRFFLFIF